MVSPYNFYSVKRFSSFFSETVCLFCLDDATQEYPETVEDEDEKTPNYEEKAQEIVQSILQEVVNTVAAGEVSSVCCKN